VDPKIIFKRYTYIYFLGPHIIGGFFVNVKDICTLWESGFFGRERGKRFKKGQN
jgi:hypothetical protein